MNHPSISGQRVGSRAERNLRARALEAARLSLERGWTVRACAKHLGVGKTTVHKDLRERLPLYDPLLAQRVAERLDQNRAERHLRGGEATKRKFKALRPMPAERDDAEAGDPVGRGLKAGTP